MRASSRSNRISWSEAQSTFGRGARAPNLAIAARLTLVLVFAAGDVQPALARGGGGPPGWTMTLNYCRETVTNKGITDVTKFEQEVKKCFANPVTYPPAYPKPTW
jgi:hypothetical protein